MAVADRPQHHRSYPTALTQIAGRNARLRALIARDALLIAPGAFDCITGRLVQQAGFDALYLSGAGISMSQLGAPDLGLLSFHEIVDRAKRIADVVDIPVIADGDTGFGGPLNVIRMVREFERAGISAVQIEDQQWPKKCGHEPGRRLVGTEEMIGRIKAAVDARADSDFVVIARTDARASEGLEAALDRMSLYIDAGADVAFVEAPESVGEMRRINARLADVPTMANMVEGGRTPVRPAAELQQLGYTLAIFPNSLTRMLGKMGQELMAALKQTGSTEGMRDRMLGHDDLWALFDNALWRTTEDKFSR